MRKIVVIAFLVMFFNNAWGLEVIDVSSQKEGFEADKAIDGNESTMWTSSKGMTPAWITIDLGRVTTVQGLAVDWGENAALSYKILLSSGGKEWRKAADVSDGISYEKRIIFFDEQKARYIKVFSEAGVKGDIYSISELNPLCVITRKNELNPMVSVRASSNDTGVDGPRSVYDGDNLTRWGSKHRTNYEWIELEFAAIQKVKAIEINWERAAARKYTIETSIDGKTWELQAAVNDGKHGEKRMIFLEEEPEARFIKINCFKRASMWGYSIWEITPVFSGKPRFPEGSMAKSKSKGKIKFDRFQSKAVIPLKKEYFYKPASKKLIEKVTASSSRENHEAVKAVDAGIKTYWFSHGSGEQWLQIKFKENVILANLKIRWNREAAAHFKIQVSDNGVKWNEVKDVDHVGEWDNRLIKFDSVACRFMRILCICPCHYGYSIRDIKINLIHPRAIWKKKRM
ncbi:MAG: discoidin domain-containing protein [Candidatus Auribacterota bacterium]|nr:discoidin domain-containing protein [Candidatus Auribacterota bacterium]